MQNSVHVKDTGRRKTGGGKPRNCLSEALLPTAFQLLIQEVIWGSGRTDQRSPESIHLGNSAQVWAVKASPADPQNRSKSAVIRGARAKEAFATQ